MATQSLDEPLKVGTAVRILSSGYGIAKIAEYRGPLGGKGARVYRVLVQEKPWPVYIEVREEQLEVLDERAVMMQGLKRGKRVRRLTQDHPIGTVESIDYEIPGVSQILSPDTTCTVRWDCDQRESMVRLRELEPIG
jgi:hypothetical protein